MVKKPLKSELLTRLITNTATAHLLLCLINTAIYCDSYYLTLYFNTQKIYKSKPLERLMLLQISNAQQAKLQNNVRE